MTSSQPQVSTFTIDKQNERTYLITNLWSSVYIPWKRLGCFHWENWSDTSFDLTVISLFEEWYVIRYISKDQTTNFELWLHWNLHTDTLSQICFGFDFDVFFLFTQDTGMYSSIFIYFFGWWYQGINEIVCHKKSIVSFLHI